MNTRGRMWAAIVLGLVLLNANCRSQVDVTRQETEPATRAQRAIRIGMSLDEVQAILGNQYDLDSAGPYGLQLSFAAHDIVIILDANGVVSISLMTLYRDRDVAPTRPAAPTSEPFSRRMGVPCPSFDGI